MGVPGYPLTRENIVFYAAAPGTTIRGFAVPRIASTIDPASATTLSVFASVVRPQGSSIALYPLAFLFSQRKLM